MKVMFERCLTSISEHTLQVYDKELKHLAKPGGVICSVTLKCEVEIDDISFSKNDNYKTIRL